MEVKEMNKRKISILMCIIGLIIIIVVAVVVELNKEQKLKEYEFAIKTIENAANDCVSDKKCNSGKITLKELYDKKYLKRQINPNTNEYFNEQSYVTYPELSFYVIDK